MIPNGQACELIVIVLCSKTMFGKASFDVIASDGVSKTLSNAHQGCCGESCQLHCGFFWRQELLNGKSLETTFTMYLHIVPEVLMDGLHDVLELLQWSLCSSILLDGIDARELHVAWLLSMLGAKEVHVDSKEAPLNQHIKAKGANPSLGFELLRAIAPYGEALESARSKLRPGKHGPQATQHIGSALLHDSAEQMVNVSSRLTPHYNAIVGEGHAVRCKPLPGSLNGPLWKGVELLR